MCFCGEEGFCELALRSEASYQTSVCTPSVRKEMGVNIGVSIVLGNLDCKETQTLTHTVCRQNAELRSTVFLVVISLEKRVGVSNYVNRE